MDRKNTFFLLMVLGPYRPTEQGPIMRQRELDAKTPFFGTFQHGSQRVRSIWSNFVTSLKVVVDACMRALWKGIDAHNTIPR